MRDWKYLLSDPMFTFKVAVSNMFRIVRQSKIVFEKNIFRTNLNSFVFTVYLYDGEKSASLLMIKEFEAGFYCTFNFDIFPFDLQHCTINISVINKGSFRTHFIKNVSAFKKVKKFILSR